VVWGTDDQLAPTAHVLRRCQDGSVVLRSDSGPTRSAGAEGDWCVRWRCAGQVAGGERPAGGHAGSLGATGATASAIFSLHLTG
jgi:hypothetical protein